MPLTREQFEKLDAAGFSPEEIAQMEQRRTSEQPQPSQEPTQAPQQGSILSKLAEPAMGALRQGVAGPLGSLVANRISPTDAGRPEEQFLTNMGNTAALGIPKVLAGADFPQAQTWQEGLAGNVGSMAGYLLPWTIASKMVGSVVNGSKLMDKLIRGSLAGGLVGYAETPSTGFKDTGARKTQATIGAVAGASGEAIMAGLVKFAEKAPGIASRMVNSLIKPRHKDFMFGKDPGGQIAKEGIVATDLENLYTQVGTKIDDIMGKVKEIRNSSKNFDVAIDLADSIRPAQNLYGELSKSPRVQQAELTQLKKIIDDFQRLPNSSFRKLNKVDLNEAYELKKMVSKMQNWGLTSESGNEINKAVRQVYHNIDKKIDLAIPELKTLNERVSNLISAQDAIGNRLESLRKQDLPFNSVMKLVDIPLGWTKSTKFKTGVAKKLMGLKPSSTTP